MIRSKQAESCGEGVAVESLDPSVYLALVLLRQQDPERARRITRTYTTLSGDRIQRALVPGFVAALAVATGGGVCREGDGAVDYRVVARGPGR